MADVNYRSYYGEKGVRVTGETLPPTGVDPKAYSDVLKFSICEDSEANGCYIRGGTENCVDAVRGSDYRVIDCSVDSLGGLGAFTIKGAIQGFLLKGCSFFGHGTKYDVELGQFDDYWYPFRKATAGIVLDACTSSDGKPIVVQVWDAKKPKVVNSNVKIVNIPCFIWFPYFCYRYIQNKIKK